ncbi:adhesion G protein-coupled receptor E3-like [Pygocentrus nattereri]|uniref:adhesion G protein-coupled receptor E3-like n=1 Tax=Pygocentrus nattereri TaxID=42514 RepID=UPI000814507A|nr:adhesion G protein-coupled receptor E3-like [Pygocentrus nattereri]
MNSVQNVAIGNQVLNRTEILVSTLVNRQQDNYSVFSFSVQGLEVQVFAVGLNASLNNTPQLSINNAQMNIDLIQISVNSNGSAAVAFMSYTNLSSVLKPSLFSTTNNAAKTMMSTVISATLPRTTNQQLDTPVNFTLKHIAEIDPSGRLHCVYWDNTQWTVDGCDLLQTNSSHSVCSCVHLSTFALIMQTNSDPVVEHIIMVAVAVGLVFLSLALLTFAVYRQNLRVTNTAQINLCISLLLAHLLFLLTQKFIHYIRPQQLLCAVLAGVLHFLFLSAFVWMFIEAVLLFISVKNLTTIRSKVKESLQGKWVVVIGYAVPLAVVFMSAGLAPNGYGSEKCWLRKDFLWSFLGPVSFILAANTVLFISILVILFLTLKNMKDEILKIKRSESDHRLFRSVAWKAMMQIIILGCSWILGFFADDNKALEIVFIVLNSQQGTFIFLVHCVFNQEVRQLYVKWWRGLWAVQAPPKHDSTTLTSEF